MSYFLYTITEEMKNEYSYYFNKECKVLFKGYDFNSDQSYKVVGYPLKIVYMGNIGAGRWRVLERVVESLKLINKDNKQAELYIYTMTPQTEQMKKRLNCEGCSYLMPPVPNEAVIRTMESADILLHVEPTKLKERLYFRLSFSTKLVDYFHSGKCIFACGGNTAAMAYLVRNDSAIVQLDEKHIGETLEELLRDHLKIELYAKKAWNCGERNHDIYKIREMLYTDFKKLVDSRL